MPSDPTPTGCSCENCNDYELGLNARKEVELQARRVLRQECDEAYARGIVEGLRRATEAVRAQASLPDLVHFDRPSDFRKGVLSCLAALEARNHERKPDAH